MSSGARVLDGKLAIVTGSSRGIGAAISRNLAAKGCSIVLNYTSSSSKSLTESLAKELESEHGVRTAIVQADMGTVDGAAQVVSGAKDQLSKSGDFRIDIIINNAGVMTNLPVEECNPDDFAFVYNINVRGPLLLVKAALPYMPTDRSGRIVNISSISSMCGLTNQSVYGGTKGALEAMTRVWARELAERCTSNAINAGPVDGDMYNNNDEGFYERIGKFNALAPLMKVRPGVDDERITKLAKAAGGTRPAYDWEVAGIVGMICTPESGWCTGCTISANGGFKFNF